MENNDKTILVVAAAYTYNKSKRIFTATSKKPKASATGDTLPLALAQIRLEARQAAAEELDIDASELDARVEATTKALPGWIVDYPPRAEGDGGYAQRSTMTWRREYSNGAKGGKVDVLLFEYAPDDPAGEGNFAAVVKDAKGDAALLGWADSLDDAIALADQKATPTASKLGMGGWAHEDL